MINRFNRLEKLELAFGTIHSFITGSFGFQELTDAMLSISGAAYVSLNIFDENKKEFRTVAIAGIEFTEDLTKEIGFDPFEIVWTENSKRSEVLEKEILMISDIGNIAEGVLPADVIELVKERYGIRYVAISKIETGNESIGDFTMMFTDNAVIDDEDIIRLFSLQVGLVIEKRNATEKVSGSKSRVDFILDSAGAGSYEWNISSGENRIDERWANILGYSLDELIPANYDTWSRLVHPDDQEFVYSRINEVLENNKAFFSAEYRMLCKDGSTKWVLDMGKVITRASDGAPILMYGTIIDITDKRKMKMEIKESEGKFKALVESSFAILYELSEEGLFRYISPAWTRLLGHSVEDAIGMDFRPYVHPEDLGKVENLFREIKSDKTRKQLSGYRLKSNSGEWRWFETNAAPLWDDEEKEIIGYAGTARDITELADFAAELKNQHDELERFFAVNLDLLCIADMEGRFLKANLAWETTLGYPMDVIISSRIQDLIHQDDLEATNAAMARLNKGETVINFTNRYRCADGSYKLIEWRSIPYENLVYGSARDITDSKRMEENLYIEKELFRTTLLSVGDGVISTDREGRITIMNHVAESLTGWGVEEAVGKSLLEIFEIYQEGSAAPYERILEKTIESDGIVDLGDIILSSRKGFDIHVEVSSSPIKDRYGIITGVVIVFRDFTEKREKHREVEYLSFHDHLTGLYNRRYMEDSIARLDTPRNIPFSVLMLDVNGLKLTNDIFGHGAGDELLRTVARILLSSCRADDIVCRVGGDEFAVLLPHTDPDSVERVKNRIADAAAAASLESIIVSISIGYAVKTDKSRNMVDVLKDADDQMYRNKLLTSEALRLQIIEKVLLNIYSKYDNEKSHSERVSRYSREIAVQMGLEEKQIDNLNTAGLLHDIGKITMPPNILNKNGKLTVDEYEDVKRHSGAGYRILRAVDEYAGIAEIVLYHHERPDGKGYPMGLKGEEIPLESRIIAVADAFEAMTSNRPYREKFNLSQAIVELRNNSGTQFDSEVVEIFINKVLKSECGETSI
jgi:diguanylate cyclase (GGDEF)-like protein/PAS domain S-box-containing protein